MSMEKIFGSLLWKGWRILEQLAPAEVTEHSYLIELEGCLSLVAMDDEDVTVDIWILRNFEHYFILHKTWGELDLAENFGWNTSVVFTYTESFSNAVVTWIQSIGQVWSMKEKMIFSWLQSITSHVFLLFANFSFQISYTIFYCEQQGW
ncbi:uncharacterized protein LOC119989153 isoform X3 [Tripterygium wilfordii]|uniref:uncharacterized protein LOC119989153 isoform X3 n=1 Tax=Tripterygium wilfordii TaxID=458696 RepID=UPI0018F7FFEE|nr:uncharacterized protein LOC119989153 isoform X3 [Tripterygium wilfordii]